MTAPDSLSTPDHPPRLVALEFVVDELDMILELLVGLLGFTVIAQHPHPALDADVIVLDADPIAISLLHRTQHGDRPAVPPTASNLTQLIFDVGAAGELAALRHRLSEAGAPVVEDGPEMFHLGKQLTTATFGVGPAMVFTVQAEDG